MKLHHQTGIIMIEVLVSIAVVAFGILGLAALQTYSLQAAKEAYTRSIASDLANDLADRVRALRTPTLYDNKNSNTDTSETALPKCKDNAGNELLDLGCDAYFVDVASKADKATCGTSVACSEYFDWKALVSSTLPVGNATFCRDSSPDDATCTGLVSDPLVIKITWTERSGKKDNDGKFVNETRRFYTSFQ